MRYSSTLHKRYLAAVLFTAVGLALYGCGDSATVNPEVELSRLSVNPGTLQPGFSGGTTQYSVNLTSDTTTVTVSAQPAVSGDSVTIDGQATTSRPIALDPPGSTTVVDIVVSESNTSSRTYTVRLVRAGLAGNNSLQSLAVSPGALAPDFDPNTLPYTVTVASNVESIDVIPAVQDSNATMTVNGQPATSGQARTITLNDPGQSTTLTITVTAQNGNPKTYLLTVSRGVSNNNNLQSLGVSPGTLAPSFSARSTDYTVNVGTSVSSLRVTPTLDDTTATMTVNGQATNSGQARTITLRAAGLSTLIPIVVTAQNGSQKTYVVEVVRAALGGNKNLQSLAVTPGTLTPNFNPNTLPYTVTVANNVGSVNVTPTVQDSNATMTVNGQATNSGQARTITLRAAGLSTLIPIVVTAQNGSQKTYVVEVVRAALGGNNNLSGLSVSPGPLAPAFAANTTSYSVDVGSGVSSVTVTPTLQDASATMTVNGQTRNSGQALSIALSAAGLNTSIPIVVTAQNGSQKTYTVNVSRAALGGNNNLSGLTVSPGTLSPTFSAARIAYTVNVGSSDTAILVTATPQDSSATVTINGQGPNSRSLPLPGGPSSTEIEVRVIAPNGNDKTYLITVNQPAPAAPTAPTVAPDLIEEDDSCPLDIPNNPDQCVVGSKDDNITNVTTPRFRIPAPGAGQTPSLYSGDDQVPANFNQGNNTLQPTSALSDGEHSISYTLSNAGSESGKSPALTVTIDSAPPPAP